MSKAGSKRAGSTPGGYSGVPGGRTSSSTPYGRTASPGGTAASFMNERGIINFGRVAEAFHMSRTQLADTAGIAPSTVAKTGRQSGAKAQARIAEVLEVINRVKDWAGGEAQAMAWFRSQPIPALGGRTAEALVKQGEARVVRDYLDHLALGGYA